MKGQPLKLLRRDGKEGLAIYDFIRSHVPTSGPGLTADGETLPDEASPEGKIRWAPGAIDGVSTHHFGSESDQEQFDAVFRLVRRAALDRVGSANIGQIDRLLRKVGVNFVGLVDPFLERIRWAGLPSRALHSLGLDLATKSRTRNGAKLGIALLGLVEAADSREVLLTLGRHDEFTLYSAVALASTQPDPDQALWELAKHVDGWGRIHVVERLKDTQVPEIRDWILREGFRNQIMNEYLAYIAATTGELAAALQGRKPDDQLLTAACDIVSALIRGGPAEGIDDYADAPTAVDLLVRHLEGRASTLHHLLTIEDVHRFLSTDHDRWTEPLKRGWTPALREALVNKCREIKGRSTWAELTLRSLDCADPTEFHEAVRAARLFGIDTFDADVRRVEADPLGDDWYSLMQVVDKVHIDQVVELAE